LSPRKEWVGIAVESEISFDSVVNFPERERQLLHLDFGRIPNGYGWVFPKKEWLLIGIGGMFRETEKTNPVITSRLSLRAELSRREKNWEVRGASPPFLLR